MDGIGFESAEAVEQGAEQAREGRFADPAQGQGRQRDAELAGRQVGVEVLVDAEQDAAAPADPFGETDRLGVPQLDQGEFGCDEKAVEDDQQERCENVENVGEHRSSESLRAAKSSIRCRPAGPAPACKWPAGRDVLPPRVVLDRFGPGQTCPHPGVRPTPAIIADPSFRPIPRIQR